jgi:PTH2 family peptidyl-tRNA hydrolase
MNEETKILSKQNEVKQVIIIRKDLKMRRGKEIAQGAHAAMAFLSKYIMSDDTDLTDESIHWLSGLFTKIVLTCNSESELLALYRQAVEQGLTAHIIQDAGLTEFGGVPTYTALAIGPNYSEKINLITGGLSLY